MCRYVVIQSLFPWTANPTPANFRADVCDDDARNVCAAANKNACETGSTACTGCKSGFKQEGDECIGSTGGWKQPTDFPEGMRHAATIRLTNNLD